MRHFSSAILSILFLSLACTLLLRCKKDKNNPNTKVHSADAIVIYTGPLEVDGCGWLIKVNDSTYNAVNLDNAHETNNLKVHISYEPLTTKYHCGIADNIYSQIKINSIQTVQ